MIYDSWIIVPGSGFIVWVWRFGVENAGLRIQGIGSLPFSKRLASALADRGSETIRSNVAASATVNVFTIY